ncbi:MAG: ATPase domain-containing protein, partial [Candidatus Anstonellales archaeon]
MSTLLLPKFNVPELDISIPNIFNGTTVCICGKPGSGKTSLCLTIVKNCINYAKEKVIYFSTKEKVSNIINYANKFGIDLEKLMYDNQFYIELLRPVDIKMMAKNESIKIFELSQAYKASKIVIDSFNYISEAFDNTYEKMTYSLKILNDISNYCPMLITTYDIRKKDFGKFNLEYISDINLILDYYYESANNYIKRYLL